MAAPSSPKSFNTPGYQSAFLPLLRRNIKNNYVTVSLGEPPSPSTHQILAQTRACRPHSPPTRTAMNKKISLSNTCVCGQQVPQNTKRKPLCSHVRFQKRSTDVLMSLPAAVSVSCFPKYITPQPHGPRSSSDTESIELSFKPSATMCLFKPLGSRSS